MCIYTTVQDFVNKFINILINKYDITDIKKTTSLNENYFIVNYNDIIYKFYEEIIYISDENKLKKYEFQLDNYYDIDTFIYYLLDNDCIKINIDNINNFFITIESLLKNDYNCSDIQLLKIYDDNDDNYFILSFYTDENVYYNISLYKNGYTTGFISHNEQRMDINHKYITYKNPYKFVEYLFNFNI
jgi:hypothetical protein